MFKYGTKDYELFLAIEHPNDVVELDDNVKYAQQGLEHLRIRQRLQAITARLTMAATERALEDAKLKLTRMENDAKAMSVKAPVDGLMSISVPDAGEPVSPRSLMATIVDPSALEIGGTLDANSLRVLEMGSKVDVWIPSRPEFSGTATVDELYRALDHARMSPDVGVVLLTGNGPSAKDGGWAFCSGGDQRIRGRSGYQYADGETADTVDAARAGRLHILEVQRLIRFMPKVVICLVNGWAAGGGHSLHVTCDLTLASREHARFKQTDADVGSFDGGYGSAYLAKQVGQKFAREIFFLGEDYTAEQMHQMGAVNRVVEHAELENVGLDWAAKINAKSPQAQRMLKFAFNLLDDGLVGQQIFAGEATRLAYMTDEAVEGRDAFLEKRDPDYSPFPRYF